MSEDIMKKIKWICEYCGKHNEDEDPFPSIAPLAESTCECEKVHRFKIDLYKLYYGNDAPAWMGF
jgi:hypothetical protein